jgi:hypothetical protein
VGCLWVRNRAFGPNAGNEARKCKERDMIRTKKEGSRRRRAAVVGGIAASAVMAFGAASASAATVNFDASFDDAALFLPITGKTDILNPPPPATMHATNLDNTTPANEPFTVLAADFHFPSFSGTASGIPVTVDFFSVGTGIHGHLNADTGALTTDIADSYEVDVTALGNTCHYNPVHFAFSTDAATDFNGHTFHVTATPDVVIDTGILQTSWTAATFPPGMGTGSCTTIDGLVHSNGALALGNGFDLTPEVPIPPDTGAPVPAPKKKCKKAKKKHSASSSKKSKGCKKKKKK